MMVAVSSKERRTVRKRWMVISLVKLSWLKLEILLVDL